MIHNMGQAGRIKTTAQIIGRYLLCPCVFKYLSGRCSNGQIQLHRQAGEIGQFVAEYIGLFRSPKHFKMVSTFPSGLLSGLNIPWVEAPLLPAGGTVPRQSWRPKGPSVYHEPFELFSVRPLLCEIIGVETMHWGKHGHKRAMNAVTV